MFGVSGLLVFQELRTHTKDLEAEYRKDYASLQVRIEKLEDHEKQMVKSNAKIETQLEYLHKDMEEIKTKLDKLIENGKRK